MSDIQTNLPAFLKRTPAEIETAEAQQSEWRQALHGRVQRNAEERVVARGIELESSIRATLAVNQDDHMLSKLADALAMQGRYAEAAVVEPSEEKTLEYQAIHEAIERNDKEKCDCPQFVNEIDPKSGKQIRLPVQNVQQMVFSQKHGSMMPVVTCAHCGDIQVSALSNFPQLAKRAEGIEVANSNARKSSVQTRVR